MTDERHIPEEHSLAMIDAKKVVGVCGDAARTERLAAWMDEMVAENVTLMSALVESGDEKRAVRLEHLASQISVYRRIKDAALRALDSASGQPPDGVGEEPAGGDPL